MRPWTADLERKRGRAARASMGPRPCGRGRQDGKPDQQWKHHASMGPRPCGRGRLPRPKGAKHVCHVLQWGHGLAAVDGANVRLKVVQGRELQWGHGLAAVDGSSPPATPSPPARFNGATALRPWTGIRVRARRRQREASMGPRPCGRGRVLSWPTWLGRSKLQWGHGLAAVDGGHFFEVCLYVDKASMGPRPCGRGRAAGFGARRTRRRGFNGATALRPWTGGSIDCPAVFMDGLQWGHGLAAVDGRACQSSSMAVVCFNGATALRPWTVVIRLGTARPRGVLQWGHGLAAVDGSRPSASARRRAGFNGATALRPWTEKAPRNHP